MGVLFHKNCVEEIVHLFLLAPASILIVINFLGYCILSGVYIIIKDKYSRGVIDVSGMSVL